MHIKTTRWLLSLVLVLALCTCVLNISASAAEDSPTKLEIREKWQTVTSATDIFDSDPSITAPYATGTLSDSFLESGITYFNYVRFVAGLPEVQLDDTLNEDAQHGAVTLAALDTLTHYPSQPADMDDDFYARAYRATTSSNIGANKGYNPLYALQLTVESCMDDNSSYTNLSTVGHRRWVLNPTLGKIGFGYAQSDSGWNYIVNHVHDRSGTGFDYDFIAWPVAGNHPSNLFNTENPWSITLNPSIYQTPSASKVKITITRESDGRTWNFDSSTGQPVSPQVAYMVVNNQGYGISNCIIFHPGSLNVDAYEGDFTVDISGIYYTDGTAATLHYEVDFFDPEAPCTSHEYEAVVTAPTCTAQGYTTYTCTVCGDSYVSDYTAAAHIYEAVTIPATCTNDGSTTYTCGVCGDSYTETLPAIGHQFTGGQCGNCGTPGGVTGNLNWILENGVLTISGTGTMTNFTYKSEMPWYTHADQISAVELKSGVTSIGDYAFYGLPNMETISIPDSVTYIGAYAFKNSTALDGVVLPEGLTKLGESAFYSCTSLTAVDIPASLWTVQPYTFKNCTALKTVTFHEGNLQKISDGAFYNTGLTELALPDCLDILDVYTFKNCADLASVTLGSSLTEIREAAFYGTAISSLRVPDGITKVGPYAFKNCVKLQTINLPATLTSIGEASFYACTGLRSLVLPDAVTTIGSYAFRRCTALETAVFSDNLASIGESAFYGCTGLTALNIPDNVTTIGAYAFKGCTGITAVTLGRSMTSLGDSAFHTCTGLKTIVLPASVSAIGEYCFSGSYNLWQITFTGDAPAIGTDAFKGLTATAYYPGSNATWTSAIMQNYGGTITWKAS